MHVLFVHTAFAATPFCSSIAALSAVLKRAGHTTSLLTVRDEAEDDEIVAAVKRADPEVIGFSFMTCRQHRVRHVSDLVRTACRDVPIIAGGAHPTTYPQETLSWGHFDAVFCGEADQTLLDWLADPDGQHFGVLSRDMNDTPGRARVSDVDALPDWDRGLFGDVSNAGNRFEIAVGVAFARGFCPFKCTFCGIDGYRRLHEQPTKGAMRMRGVQRVIDELLGVEKVVPVPSGFAAWDAVFPLERAWVGAFADAYAERVAQPLAVQLRVEQVTDFLIDALRRAGCDYAVIGMECGDEEYRRRFLDKPFKNEAAKKAVTGLQAAGITVHASFMLGLPFETKKHLASTIRFAQSLNAKELSWKYYTPERGTRLYKLCSDNELLIERFVDHPFGANRAMIRLMHSTQSDLDRTQFALSTFPGAVTSESRTEIEPPLVYRR
jgi:anaerobic magnesium-protoporphyrin IX monomethyl ester cyclase